MSLITSMWRSQPGRFFCACTKDGGGKWREHFFRRNAISEFDKFVRDHSHSDQYFCPHGFSQGIRQKKYAEAPSLLWADLDAVDPRELGSLKPTIAIESSPGRYVGLWMVDRAINEQTNRQLTYKLGADHGGWDFTQVLRIPGTTNYKYHSTPRVKLMWEDGPTYRLDEIKKRLGTKETNRPLRDDGRQIFKHYERKVPYWVRNELYNGHAEVGKRSSMLWKLEHALMEAGAERDETLAMIKASPWNKFAGRASEDEQLAREVDKVYEGQEEKVNGYSFLSKPMSEVEEKDITWIWYPYLARGEVTIIEGDPGVGKSYLAEIIAKAIVDGDRLPSVKRYKPVTGKIAYFDIENDASTVTKKRLKYNGCKNMENFYQEEEPFSIDDKKAMEEVYDALERVRPLAVFFDTINLYIGKADTGKANETTQALSVFKDIAKRFECSVVVLRHLTKGNTREKALYRGQGNIAFAGVSRILITVGTDPEDKDIKAMSVTKINLTKTPDVLTFSVDELPDTLRESDRSVFKWHGFRHDLNSEDILKGKPDDGDRIDVKDFLMEILEEGERPAREIEVMAEKRAISPRTLQRVATQIGVQKVSRGFGPSKVAVWKLDPE